MRCKCLMVGIKGRKSRDAQKSGLSFLPEYKIWSGIRTRCNPKTIRGSGDYRGVRVSFEWAASFERFMRDMGRRPGPRYSVDRKDGSLGYCRHNCRWATPHEQVLNRRTTINKNGSCGIKENKSGTFTARISILGRMFHIGTFTDKSIAMEEFNRYSKFINKQSQTK